KSPLGKAADKFASLGENNLITQLAASIQAKGIAGGLQDFLSRQGEKFYETYVGDHPRIVNNPDGTKTIHIPSWLSNAALAGELGGPEPSTITPEGAVRRLTASELIPTSAKASAQELKSGASPQTVSSASQRTADIIRESKAKIANEAT